jgi:DNA mismatch repair protein MutL
MPKINILDNDTINKIAAGEVIDRPASIVKELIENSLDAQATVIQIETSCSGKHLIKISDNGFGIEKEDLPLVPIRHATSKINKLEDIYQTNHLGFRGEALASICHIAEVEIVSKTTTADGHKITCQHGKISTVTAAPHTNGTTVYIKNIFKNLPVRQKFLKSDATELSYIVNVVQQFSLIYPKISFILLNNQKEMLNTTGLNDQKTLLIHYYGKEIASKLIKLDTEIASLSFTGYISDPTLTYPTKSKQLVAINHRLIQNPLIQKAIMQSYLNFIPQKRYPLILLNISLAKETIDINIHPQKTDLKFLNPGLVFDAFPKIIKANLQKDHQNLLSSLQDQPTNTYLNSLLTTTPSHHPSLNQYKSQETPISQTTIPTKTLDNLYQPEKNISLEYLQLYQTYLLIKGENSLYILDQHACHERILYEKFQAKALDDDQKQLLLISEIIDLSPHHFTLLQNDPHLLSSLKIDFEEFGPHQIAIQALPLELTDAPLHDLITLLLDNILSYQSQNISPVSQEKLEQLACKAAIKAGKKMTPLELEQLLADFIACPANFTCPHGRPIYLELTKSDFEKFFHRK